MTSVLKDESSAGESYEALLDGARSLVTGLGSMLRVSSYGARVYSSMLNENSADTTVYNRRRRSFREWTLSFSSLLGRRSKRGTISQQLQAQKEVVATFIVYKYSFCY